MWHVWGNGCKVLAGKRVTKKPLRRPSHRWEDIIKMGLEEMVAGRVTGFIWLIM
jgi:hypothetical protein